MHAQAHLRTAHAHDVYIAAGVESAWWLTVTMPGWSNIYRTSPYVPIPADPTNNYDKKIMQREIYDYDNICII